MRAFVGIDLGTTYSAIAVASGDREPVVIRNREGQSTTPSAVAMRDGVAIVGQEAKEAIGAGLAPGAMFFKRAMADLDYAIPMGGREYGSVELSAMVLGSLKKDAERELGHPVDACVVTVPAYFADAERSRTRDAGYLAGFSDVSLINEPTAAALAHGLSERESDARHLLVYDLGGGTFDVTIARTGSDGIVVLNSDGDHELGGKDWDDRLIKHLATLFEDEFGVDPTNDAETREDLRARCEQAKRQLSSRESVVVSFVHDAEKGRYEVSRELFEELTADLLGRTAELTRAALADAGVALAEISDVLLVGGSTRMPMVREFIEGEVGRPAMRGVNVDEAVAIGAALVHRNRSALVEGGELARLVDVTNRSLGMIAVNEDRSAFVNSIVLPKNQALPCTASRPFRHTVQADRDEPLEIYVTQGESSDPLDVVYLDRHLVRGIPAGADGLAVVDVGYAYDLSGIVEVTCALRDGTPLEVEVDRLPADVPSRFGLAPEAERSGDHRAALLCFDLSGSMSGRPLGEAKRAAVAFLAETDLAHASLGIVAFSDSVAIKLAPSQDAKAIEAAIDGLVVCETGVGNATDPFRELLAHAEGESTQTYAVVLTDGMWNHQREAAERAKRCHEQGVDVIAIGFGTADQGFLGQIASCEEASFFTSVDRLVDTFSSIAQVLTESELSDGAKEVGARLGMRWAR